MKPLVDPVAFSQSEKLGQVGGALSEVIEQLMAHKECGPEQLNWLFQNREKWKGKVQKILEMYTVSDEFAEDEKYHPVFKDEDIFNREVTQVGSQIESLQEMFPELKSLNLEITDQPLPPYAQSWFAIPRWQRIERNYRHACLEILDRINRRRDRSRHPTRLPVIVSDISFDFRPCARSAAMWQQIEEQQKESDILFVPAQFLEQYPTLYTPRRARARLKRYEFGLGIFAGLSMYITNHDRFRTQNAGIQCIGDNVISLKVGAVPSIYREFPRAGGERLTVSSADVTRHNSGFTNITAFLPLELR